MSKIYFINTSSSDKRIWRYMDLSKFLSLLEYESLFFTPLQNFEDRYEGIYNCFEQEDLYDVSNEGELLHINKANSDVSDVRMLENTKVFKEAMSFVQNTLLQGIGVSCWRLEEGESHAMWRIYLKSDEGVAIVSTVNKLTSLIEPQEYSLGFGEVKYIDRRKEKMTTENMFNSVLHKESYFAHEREVRLFCYQQIKNESQLLELKSMPSTGLSLPINPSKLIDEIYISPYASKWFGELVKNILNRRYNFSIPVKESIIALH